MSPTEDRTGEPRKQGSGRPRARECLLKGCGQRFRPEDPRERYCADACRAGARRWSTWKAGQRYRKTPGGRRKRSQQSRRHRRRKGERRDGETRGGERIGAARAISQRGRRIFLRPSRLLRDVHVEGALSFAPVLHEALSARGGARIGARAPMGDEPRLGTASDGHREGLGTAADDLSLLPMASLVRSFQVTPREEGGGGTR